MFFFAFFSDHNSGSYFGDFARQQLKNLHVTLCEGKLARQADLLIES